MADKKKKAKLKNGDIFMLCMFGAAISTVILFAMKDNFYVDSLLQLIPGRDNFGNLADIYSAGLLSFLAFLVLFIVKWKPKKPDTKKALGGDIHGNSRWMTKEEINKEFPKVAFSQLSKTNVNGFIVATSVDSKGEAYANYKDGVHCLTIGTTGSGKTSRFVRPTLQMLARSKLHPSVVISDPKGELFEATSKTFEENGYKIISLNLRDVIAKSNCWNPCYRAWRFYQDGLVQKSLIKKVSAEDKKKIQDKYKFIADEKEYGEEIYLYKDMAFPSLSDAEIEAKRGEEELKAKAQDEIGDVVSALFPEKDPKDAYWINSAKNIVNGILRGMLEDSENPDLGMCESKYNLASVAASLSNNSSVMTDYFENRDPGSPSKMVAKPTLNAGGETRGTIISEIQTGLSIFLESDIQYCTCQNDIELAEIGQKPCAVYLIVPDEKENRHVFASLFITQTYKALVDLATHSGGKLPHPVNFILDEFANIPTIPGMDNKITVARSRGINFLLIVQGLNQLKQKYGAIGDIIKDNCNLVIYLASNDNETAEYFSKLCGNKTIVTKSASSSKGKDKSSSTSESLASEPLIRPEDLSRQKQGEAIVKMLGCYPAKVEQCKFWESKYDTKGEASNKKAWNRDVFIFAEKGLYDLENTVNYFEQKKREERSKKLNAKKEESPSKSTSAPNNSKPIKFDDDEDLDDDEELASIKAFLESLEIKDEEPEPSLVPVEKPISIAEEKPIFIPEEKPFKQEVSKPMVSIAEEKPFIVPKEEPVEAPKPVEKPKPVMVEEAPALETKKAKPKVTPVIKQEKSIKEDNVGKSADLSDFFGMNK